MTKKNKENKKIFFCFLGPTMITPCSYVSSFIMENYGDIVFYEKNFLKKTICSKMLISLFFNI